MLQVKGTKVYVGHTMPVMLKFNHKMETVPVLWRSGTRPGPMLSDLFVLIEQHLRLAF